MTLTSLGFVAFALVVALLSNASRSIEWRSWVLLAANGAFIASYVDRPLHLLPLAGFLALCFASIEFVRRRPSTPALWATLTLIVASFILLKKFSFLSEAWLLPFPYLLMGLSYVLFRALHLLIDARQGELKEPVSPRDFFNYTCNFLTFTAGPIQRFEAYRAQRQQPLMLDESRVLRAFSRVILGFLKVAAVSAVFDNLFQTVSGRLLDAHAAAAFSLPAFALTFVTAAVCYTVYLYYNFSGYVDIVVGVGWLCGQDLPENFNHPFLARSFLDFWSRWHMTLSDWFKTYVFNPLLKVLAARFRSPKAGPYLAVAAFFITFTIMGVWHGTTSVFVIYGLILGAGASINKLWQVLAGQRLGKKRYKALAEKQIAIYVSRGLTLAYFALALTCLWVDLTQLLVIAGRLGALGAVACYFGLALAAAAGFFAWDSLAGRLARLQLGERAAFRGITAQNLGLALQILLIVTVASFFHKAPEFVYRAF